MYNWLKIILILCLSIQIYGQNFDIEPLITTPGDNKNISISSPSIDYGEPYSSYICWENKLDSIYTIHLKCIHPVEDRIYTVYSDTTQNIQPAITYDHVQQKVIIVWQSKIYNRWRLLQREFNDDVLGATAVLTDTTTDNISPTLSNESLAWIKDGNLIYKNFLSNPEIVDSIDCSNPQLFPYENQYDPSILYEKGPLLNKKIFLARHIGQVREKKPYWLINQISSGFNDINPSFGTNYHISYQTMEENIWKIVYQDFFDNDYEDMDITKNSSCNFENSSMFTYPILSKIAYPFDPNNFLVFDSDSLLYNREIFIKTVSDTIINISNINGDDSKPKLAFLNTNDSSKIAIIWEHEENGKHDIYWGTFPFELQQNNIENDNRQIVNFNLYQNYPNPFNSQTKITYTLKKSTFVTISIFNINGQLIKVLLKEYQMPGSHSINWNANDLNSGIYLYDIATEDFTQTRKCILLR